jgi:hypothetical protein
MSSTDIDKILSFLREIMIYGAIGMVIAVVLWILLLRNIDKVFDWVFNRQRIKSNAKINARR